MPLCASCGHAAAEEFQFCPHCGTRSVGQHAHGLIGSTLVGKYRLVAELGIGSTGNVYLAEHVALRRRFAIKILHRELQVDEEALHRFQREGIAAGHLQHPNAIQIFDFDRSEDGRFFLAMEYVDGKSLRVLLDERGALPLAEAMPLVHQLLSVLEAAHAAGIVHRDLKPENLMVSTGADGLVLKVLDFGLSKLVHRPLAASLMTHAGRVLGTPMYMAPEQWRGEEADHRADLYAVGLLLFEILTGKQPFTGRDLAEVMLRSTTQSVPPLAEVAPALALPHGFDDFLLVALAKSRADRWQSAAEMLAALEPLDPASRLPTAAPRRTRARARRPQPAQPRRHRRIVAGTAAAAVVALAALLWWRGSSAPAAAATAPLVRSKPLDARSVEERAYVELLDVAADELLHGNHDAAFNMAERAIARPCVDAEGYLLRGRAYRSRGDGEFARADLQEAERRYPDWTRPAAELGWLLLERGDIAGADTEFQKVLARAADDAEALAGAGAVLLANGDDRSALRLLEEPAAKHTDCTALQLHFGRALLRAGRTDAAIAALVTARRRDARCWQADEGLGDAQLQRGDAEGAGQRYRQALAAGAPQAPLTVKLANALLASGQVAEAEHSMPPAPAAQDAAFWSEVRALAAVDRADHPAATAALAKAVASTRSPPPAALALLGALYCLAGDFSAAITACERAAAGDEGLAPAYAVWGLALHRRGESQLGSIHLERAVALLPRDAFLHRTLGLLHRDWLLQPQVALQHFLACRELGDKDARVSAWIDALTAAGVQAAAPDLPAPTTAALPADPLQRARLRALDGVMARVASTLDVFEDHASWDKAWEARSAHFRVVTTHSFGLAQDLASGLEVMLRHVQETLGVNRQPSRLLPVFVFGTIAEYNQFGTQNGQEHSSMYGSFYAQQHAERPVAAVFDQNPVFLRMQLTHSMVHEYLADAFPGHRLPVWADEGLAAYFSMFWDYPWGVAEFQRLKAAGKQPPLRQLLAEPIAAYPGSAHERFVTLAMLYYWLLLYRPDTATGPEQAPFRDYLLALLAGKDPTGLPITALLGSADALEQGLRDYQFPR